MDISRTKLLREDSRKVFTKIASVWLARVKDLVMGTDMYVLRFAPDSIINQTETISVGVFIRAYRELERFIRAAYTRGSAFGTAQLKKIGEGTQEAIRHVDRLNMDFILDERANHVKNIIEDAVALLRKHLYTLRKKTKANRGITFNEFKTEFSHKIWLRVSTLSHDLIMETFNMAALTRYRGVVDSVFLYGNENCEECAKYIGEYDINKIDVVLPIHNKCVCVWIVKR